MQVSFSGLFGQLESHKIDSEFILVDWNPPSDKPLLVNIIKWPEVSKHCTIRVLVVPDSIHHRYKYSDKIPMNAVVALNSGIRRARGKFILPITMGLLFSNELVSYIASKNLDIKERYRVDRYDVSWGVLKYETLKEQLDYCQNNIIRIHAQSHQEKSENGFPSLHTDACGDFQLMSRHHWHLLCGYREIDIIAAHVDGLLSYASYAAGVREVVLHNPMRVYHIDHDDQFNHRLKRIHPPLDKWLSTRFIPVWFSKTAMKMYHKLIGYEVKTSVHDVPTLDYSEYRRMCHEIVAGKISYIFNDENWGLGQESLDEFVVNAADWDKSP